MAFSTARQGAMNIALWLASALVLVYAIGLNLQAIRITAVDLWDDHKYTYEGMDHPNTLLPLSQHPYDSVMVVEDSVYYNATAGREWDSIFPAGNGFVRLGPDQKIYGISMYHQMHCLQQFAVAVKHRPQDEKKWEHTVHCMNYFRQMILCAANIRLEPLKPSRQGPKVDGIGLEHKCRDWTKLFELAEENHKGWRLPDRYEAGK